MKYGIAWVLLGCLPLVTTVAQESCSREQTPQQLDTKIDALIGRMTLAERIAQLRDRAPAIPQLGLPSYNWWNEGLHGLARDGYATVFPQAIGLAATWDPELLHAVGDVVSSEARDKFASHGASNTPRYGGLTIWSPNINIFRDPRWGRGQETYGEDPFLTGMLGTQFVRGVQGDDSFYLKADATPKHFAAHSGPEKGRDSFNSQVTAHDMQDTYLPAFHQVITQGQAAALMCSYNEINGIPSCASGKNLQDLVRNQWGFRGYVVSDCDAVDDITDYHHYTKDNAHGAAAALHAGVDLDCGNTYDALGQSVAQGLVTEEEINQSLHRLLAVRVRLGMMDAASCTPFDTPAQDGMPTKEHGALALRAAEESIVLLKNNGVLPLSPSTRHIAVIGPDADSVKVLEANYHGTALHPITMLEGMRVAFPETSYAQGSTLVEGMPILVPRTALRNEAQAEGLQAEYFDKASFDGAPLLRRTVSTVDLDLDRVGPVPEVQTKQYAVRWTGSLVPPAAGDYVLRVNIERCWDCTAHDTFHLLLDGKLVIDNHGKKGDTDQITLHFSDKASHPLRIELLHTGDDEGIGLEWVPPPSALLDEAVNTARTSDAIVAFMGLSPDLEGEALQVDLPGFDGGDRTSLALPAAQIALLKRLQGLHKPLIVVLTSGSAVAPGDEVKDAAAVLEAWYPGEAGGKAIARVLTGKVNPSGHLPVTFYRSANDLPAFSDYSMAHRTYRYFDGPVLYPFGYGLSYSRFAYGPVHLDQPSITTSAGRPLSASVVVRNTSRLAGTAVAELYVQPPSLPGAPRLSLQGIQRLTLKAGESRELHFTLAPEQLSTVDEAGARGVRPGTYHVFIGNMQPDIKSSAGARLKIN